MSGDRQRDRERQLQEEVANRRATRENIGQARLTDAEKRRLPLGGPDDKVNIIHAQCIKAAAINYSITDWIAKWDFDLRYDEVIGEFEKMSTTQYGGTSLRRLPCDAKRHR